MFIDLNEICFFRRTFYACSVRMMYISQTIDVNRKVFCNGLFINCLLFNTHRRTNVFLR